MANKTASGEELLEHLQEKAADGRRHVFIAVIPLQDGSGSAPREARARLAAMLDRLHDAGLIGSGMIGDPDPYTAAINALELFSGRRRGDLDAPRRALRLDALEPDRARDATPPPAKVEHVVVDLQANTTTATAAAAS